MARQKPAEHLSATVLDRPDFVAACASRDLGKVLSIAIKWGGPGFTASHVARRCSLGVSRVGEYIAGKRQAQSVDVWIRVADGLRIPGHLLNLGARPWEDEGDSVDRREFISLGSRVAASTVASGAVADGRGSRRPIQRAANSDIEREIARLRRLDDTVGGSDLYQIYKPVADRLRGTLRDQPNSSDKHGLLTALAEHLQQTGWAAFDAGHHGVARDLYQESFEVARECGNTELAANSLAFRAYQVVSSGA